MKTETAIKDTIRSFKSVIRELEKEEQDEATEGAISSLKGKILVLEWVLK